MKYALLSWLVLLVQCEAEGTPKVTLEGFSTFLQKEGLFYPRAEMSLRLRLYHKSAAFISLHNSLPDRTFDMGFNMFSSMTEAEKNQYLGLANETLLEERPSLSLLTSPSPTLQVPSSVDHVAMGIVTGVKNQGGCGSCWAFAATASFEGVYAARTWRRKDFADQELLDCTYEGSRDGCNGGWYYQAWDYIKGSRRLSLRRDIGYSAADGACDYASKHNVISNVIPESYTWVSKGGSLDDPNLSQAIYVSVPSVAITVEDDFYSYSSGIYNGCPTVKTIHHAVTAVGYDANSWKIKNSWGTGWGEAGYMRMSRLKPSICRIADFVVYPNVRFMDGLVTIRNHVTGRYLAHWDDLDDVRDIRGHQGSFGSTYAYALDANYYNLGLWKLVDAGDGKVVVEHFHSGRWLHSDGADIRNSRGSEGGWTGSPHIRVTDTNYYDRALWKIVDTGSGTSFIEHDHTGRYLFAAGSTIWDSEGSGSYGDTKVQGVDANYYNYAYWKIEALTEADMNRMIASG